MAQTSIDFEIFQASLRDLIPVRKLEKLCFPVDAWPLLDMIGALSFPNIVRYKARIGDQIVGFIAGEVKGTTQTGWIATLCVHPKYRRKGIGEELLRLCEQEMQMPRIRLTVRESNQGAIKLYETHGYYKVNRWKNYYKGGEDGVVMEKIL
ncbi:MAG: N-acetyltransferase [Anaerolineales bacterium]|jgi:ribosomal protein S18 acetylase RimI-like enzyme